MAEGTRARVLEDTVKSVQENQISMQKHLDSVVSAIESLQKTMNEFIRRSDSDDPKKNHGSTSTVGGFSILGRHKPAPVYLARFNGDNPIRWIAQATRYFDFYSIEEKDKITIASFYLDEAAADWFNWLHRHNQLTTWDAFTTALAKRFRSTDLEEPEGLLAKLQKPMFKVYRRSKSIRSKTSVGTNWVGMEAGISNGDNIINQDERRIHETQRNVNFRAVHDVSEDTLSKEKSSTDGGDEIQQEEEEDRLNSGHKVGLRSTRNRRPVDYNQKYKSPKKRKPHQLTRSSCLLRSAHEEGDRYIPQFGDEVIYCRQGHEEYIFGSHSRDMGPWRSLKGVAIRDVELCNVKDLEYSTHPGSSESCCKMTLQFVDPTSNAYGKSFKLTLPEVTGFPDFLVERSRYDAAIQRNWRHRDKCQVWWKNDGDENGKWWEGRIVAVKPKCADFPDSPWERFSIQYKNDPNVLPHSPWELYDSCTEWEEPHIDDVVRNKLIRALSKLEQSGNKSEDHYGVRKLNQVSQSSTFINRFPVPLSLEIIESRLENNYYRRFAALKHDVQVLIDNAELYFGRNKDYYAKMKRLSDWFTRTLSSL